MRELTIQAFSDEHLDASAALLAERHIRHREAEPGLPANVDYGAEIEALWQVDERSGAAATRNGELVGYLLGSHRDDETWGSNIWIEYAGHAVREPELVRDLYAVAADEWFARGRDRHYAMVPATDGELVDAWFRLSFGAQHAAAIQETPKPQERSSANVVVRRAAADDIDAVTTLDLELPRHQARSPVFSTLPPPAVTEEDRQQFVSELEDREVALFVAEIDAKLVGELLMVPAERPSRRRRLALARFPQSRSWPVTGARPSLRAMSSMTPLPRWRRRTRPATRW
jgi:hypothetical protein